MQEIVLAKINEIQAANEKVVWISGRQMVDILSKHNPASVRMALSLLAEKGMIRRERRKGRGPRGRTGQSSWYSSLEADPYLDQAERVIQAERKRVDIEP